MSKNNIVNIVIIFLGVLILLLIIKIFHIKLVQFNQQKIIKNKMKKEEKDRQKIREKLEKQDKKQKEDRLKELNINLNLPKTNAVSNTLNKIPGFKDISNKVSNTFNNKKRGILHQVSDCEQCDLVLCEKKELIDEEYPEDHYSIGKPLKEYGCENINKNTPKIYDKISGKIYVLEKIKENIKKKDRIKPTIHLIENCNECDNIDRNWCDESKFIDNHKNIIDHYNVGNTLKEYGCDKVNKDSEVIRDAATDNLYIIENETKEKNKNFSKYNDGYCQNEIIGSMENPNIDVCFNRCLKEEKCNYISYDNKSELCNRYTICDKVKTNIDAEYITYKKNNKKLIEKEKKEKLKVEQKIKKIKEENKSKIVKYKELKNEDDKNKKSENTIINKFKNIFSGSFFNKKKVKPYNYYNNNYNNNNNINRDQDILIELLEHNVNNINNDKIKLLENIIQNKKDLVEATNKSNFKLAGKIHKRLIENQNKYKKL